MWEVANCVGFVLDDSVKESVLLLCVQNTRFSYQFTSQIIWESSTERMFYCIMPLECAKRLISFISNAIIKWTNRWNEPEEEECRCRNGLCKSFLQILKQTNFPWIFPCFSTNQKQKQEQTNKEFNQIQGL